MLQREQGGRKEGRKEGRKNEEGACQPGFEPVMHDFTRMWITTEPIRWDVPAEERGRPSETEVTCTLRTRAGRPSETEAMGSPGARVGATP